MQGPFRGLFCCLAKDLERGASDEPGNDRRRNGDPGPSRSGGRIRVRLPGRRGPADLRRHVPAGQAQAHPGAPRAGRRPRRRGLCALHRQGRRDAGDLRPWRDQRRDGPHRRPDGLDPARVPHRAGADASHRQRRVPGVRHGRHHAPLHQAQLSGEERERSLARAARGVPHRGERPARSGGDRHPEGRAVRQGHVSGAEGRFDQDLPAEGQRRHRQDQDRGRHAGQRQEADHLFGRRHHQLRQGGKPSAARVRAAHRLSGDLDADGARRVPGGRSAVARHARHARHLRGELDDARLRRDAVHRRALRRPHHRSARCVRAQLAQDPRRHRSVLDQQERQGRSRRSSATARMCWKT